MPYDSRIDPLKGNALDSWRGLCALLVALFHYPVLSHIASNEFVRNSYLFVDFFFVLSGFVIAAVQDQRPESKIPFMIKRFGRIWPMHMLVLSAFVLVSLVQGDFNDDPRHSAYALITNIFMIHAWGLHQVGSWNEPSWSISVEWFVYIIFAIISGYRWKLFAYAGLVLLGIGVLFAYAPDGMGSTFDYGVFRGLAGFFIGALVARAPMRNFGTIGEAFAAICVIAFVVIDEAQFVAPFIFGAAVYVFAGSRGRLTDALKWRPLVWLGERSYTFYIVHALMIGALWQVGRSLGWAQAGARMDAGALGDLVAIPYLVGILIIAWAAYPFEDRARQVFKTIAGMVRQRQASA